MTIRRATVVAAIVALMFLPTGTASASTDIQYYSSQRTVIIEGRDGLQHTCYLRFELINSASNVYPDAATADTQSDSNDSATPDDSTDPTCADAVVEVSMTYSINGDRYTRSATRQPNLADDSTVTVVNVDAVSGQSEDGNSDFGTLFSNHRVYFPACQCAFTETLVRSK